MVLGALMPGFWWCLAGLVACSALGLFALWSLLRLFRVARTFGLHRDQAGSTIVEFPIALIVLVLMSLLTWQLGFLVSAYIVVDYAAFAAARVAIVQIPPHGSDQEPAHTVQDLTLENGDKGEEIQEAAAMVCYPISDRWTLDDSWMSQTIILGEIISLPGVEGLTDALDDFDFATRYTYAQRNTSARLLVAGKEAGQHAYAAGSLVTVEVTHVYSLRVGIAARILASGKESWGYVSHIKGQATLQYEGFGELVPADAPSGAQP